MVNAPNFDVEAMLQDFNKYLDANPMAKKTGEMFGMPPLWAISGISSFVVGFLLFGVGSNVVCNLVGFLYPAYASFKALEDGTEEDHRQWLTYWVVFSFFTLVESLVDYILYWIPLFYVVKVLFLFWLFSDRYKGATVLYQMCVRPVLEQHKTSIDTGLQKMSDSVNEMASKASTKDK